MSSRWLVLVLLVGCQPLPSEVETVGSASSGGSTSTPATTDPGTSAPGDTTVGASGSAEGSSGSSTGPVESSSSDDGASESTGDPPDEPLGPFDTPVLVAELGSFTEEDDPTLTADMLEIYFGSTRNGLEDVWMSTRNSVADAWDVPVRVDELSSGATDTLPEVSADGLFILLASDRAAFGDHDVYFSRRGNRSQPWPEPQMLPGAATAGANDFGATPSPDLTSVFLCRSALSDADVYEAPADFDDWMVGAPVLVAELTTPQDECSVTLSQSRREMFVETNRPATTLGWNLWTATREDPADPWGDPVEVAELNSDANDQDPWLSPDRHTLYFASNRDVGNTEIYMATRR